MSLHQEDMGWQLRTRGLRIPQAIWLNAIRVVVEFQDNLSHKEDAFGHAAYREMAIRIQPSMAGNERPQADIERTYCHELVHWILHVMAEDDLRGNEKFVDRFARYLHQALVMAEYQDGA